MDNEIEDHKWCWEHHDFVVSQDYALGQRGFHLGSQHTMKSCRAEWVTIEVHDHEEEEE